MEIARFMDLLAARGVRQGAGVPCSYFTPLVNHMTTAPGLDYVGAASEGEAVAIAAGMVAAGRPAFALMQNSGLGNAVNPVTSLLHPYRIPALLLVSHRGEPGRPDEPQHALMGAITEDLARLCGLRTWVLEDDEAALAAELDAAREAGGPAAWICRKGILTGGPKLAPAAPRVRVGGAAPEPPRELAAEMTREEALHAMLPLLNAGDPPPAVVSTTGKPSRELYELDDRDHARENRFYMVGSMGCAAGFGLGVARGFAGRVVVLDGDGALLMKLGTLATVGREAPETFHHVLLDNGAHDSTGGQPTASPWVDLAAVARASGYREAATVAGRDALVAALSAQLARPGPSFLRVLVRPGARADLGRPRLSPPEGWARFRRFLARAPRPADPRKEPAA